MGSELSVLYIIIGKSPGHKRSEVPSLKGSRSTEYDSVTKETSQIQKGCPQTRSNHSLQNHVLRSLSTLQSSIESYVVKLWTSWLNKSILASMKIILKPAPSWGQTQLKNCYIYNKVSRYWFAVALKTFRLTSLYILMTICTLIHFGVTVTSL